MKLDGVLEAPVYFNWRSNIFSLGPVFSIETFMKVIQQMPEKIKFDDLDSKIESLRKQISDKGIPTKKLLIPELTVSPSILQPTRKHENQNIQKLDSKLKLKL